MYQLINSVKMLVVLGSFPPVPCASLRHLICVSQKGLPAAHQAWKQLVSAAFRRGAAAANKSEHL